MKTIRALIEKYYDILVYLVFGVMTTAVNYIVYLPCYNLLGLSATVSNVIAWVVAVAFAYLTNKPFVFRSYDWSAKTVVPERTDSAFPSFISFVAVWVALPATLMPISPTSRIKT